MHQYEAKYWKIGVDAPLGILTYEVPDKLRGLLIRGQRVAVPIKTRIGYGVLVSNTDVVPEFETKPISHIDLEYPTLSELHMKWIQWISDYYIHPIGLVATMMYPPVRRKDLALKRKGGKRKIYSHFSLDLYKDGLSSEGSCERPRLSEEQLAVISSVQWEAGFRVHLLYGVTGSGKTEVYLNLLESVIKNQKKGLVLVPEISLTPQLIRRFVSRFGEKVAVIHSHLTPKERTVQWWDMVEGRKSILIGARSALFCPIENLGLIVIDEEHEPSFKQDSHLKYHGRDSAIMLAKLSQCPIVLGSATPSLESWTNAVEGKYVLNRMNHRVENRPLPDIQVINMKKNNENLGPNSNSSLGSSANSSSSAKEEIKSPLTWLSDQLYTDMISTLENGNQVALFLNLRGVASCVLCPDCGYVFECPNCDISLTLHGTSHLVCHYCNFHTAYYLNCPDCKIGELKPLGLGTEQVENEIKKFFPNHKVARADRDEIQNRDQMDQLVSEMENGKIDILVGTQMIAKGLDFPKLKLVGLVLADVGFNLPDFRATERSFQLITQMSGRAGRHIIEGESPGKVILQTYNPTHPSIVFAIEKDFEKFAEFEKEHRQLLMYPPFGKLISVRIQGKSLTFVQRATELLAYRCHDLKKKMIEKYQSVEILGPAEAVMSKIRGQYRYHMLLKSGQSRSLNYFIRQVLSDQKWLPKGVQISIDIDPIHLL